MAAILFPVFAQAKEAAKKTNCLSNQKQLAIALQLYTVDYDDNTPGAGSYSIPSGLAEDHWYYTFTLKFSPSFSLTLTPGTLDAYVKSFELTGCASGKDLFTEYAAFASNKNSLLGLMAIGRNMFLQNETNMSDVQEPGNTVFIGDSGRYATASQGYNPGVYTWEYFADSYQAAMTGTAHGRHNGKVNTAWLDGHAKSMPLTYRDCETDSSFVSEGVTRTILIANRLGWVCPPGLTAQTHASTFIMVSGISLNAVTWAPSVVNDTHFNNYYLLKKVP